jgi:hypothetical protein
MRVQVNCCWLIPLLFSACDRPDVDSETGSGNGPQPPGAEVDSLVWNAAVQIGGDGFRPSGWSGDTLWGILRGRVAFATESASGPPGATAWSLAVGNGVVAWTDDRGMWLRRDSAAVLLVPRASAPSPEHTGPDVTWSPDGRRAALAWVAESGVAIDILEGDTLRRMEARVPGYMTSARLQWVDERRLILSVIANAGLDGASEHRESGYRGDLAVLDVDSRSIRVITSAKDGEYYVPEGMLAPDSLLVGIRAGNGWPERHSIIVAGAWSTRRDVAVPGRAAAAHGMIALLQPSGTAGAEPLWDLVILSRDGKSEPMRFQGHDVRLLWHSTRAVLAVAQESETAGTRTVLIKQQ